MAQALALARSTAPAFPPGRAGVWVAGERYIESLSDYGVIHTADDAYTTKERISDLAEQLAPHGFIRIHRSFLIAPRHVDAFTAQAVQVGGQTLSVSRTYRKQALARLREDDA